jgi:hypothetical protein
MTAATKHLAHKPFDAIAYHGIAHLSADGDPQSGFCLAGKFTDNDEVGRVGLFADP